MSDEIQSSESHDLSYYRVVAGEQIPVPEDAFDENDNSRLDSPEEEEDYSPSNFDESSIFSAEYQGRVRNDEPVPDPPSYQAEDRVHRQGAPLPMYMEIAEYVLQQNQIPEPEPEPEPPSTGALATMPTFQHKFPNGETVAAKIHPNGGGVVCEESEIGNDVYISKASTVYKSKVEEGFISQSSVSDCEIRTANIIDSQLRNCNLSESCCNGLKANNSKFSFCTLTGSVSDSTLKNTFLIGAEVEECTMEFCRLQGSYKESTLKSCVIIGTVYDCEINNSEITRAQLKGIKGHIADTGRTKRVQYFIVEDKIHITYRANQSMTIELDLTAREFRSQVKAYMERIGALKFNEEARKREIDWLCSNYKIFRKETPAVEDSSTS